MGDAIPEEAVELLTSEPLVAHLATAVDDRPHVAPVWFVYHDDAIEVVTTGRKLTNIRRNPRVALSVQKADEGEAKWGVTMRGTATVVEDDGTIRRRINRRYDAEEDDWEENKPVRIDVGSTNYWTYD